MGKIEQLKKENKGKKKKAGKKPEDFTVNFLREIPGPEGKGISLKKLTEGDARLKAWSEQILLFLKIFDVITITEGKDSPSIKAVSRSAKDFIVSFALYIEKGFPLVTEWDKHLTAPQEERSTLLDRGINLLTAMEERRAYTMQSNEPLDQVKINLFVIKANVKGTNEPQYLMEYNIKTHKYQFVGGYMTGATPLSRESYERLALKDLPLNNFDPDKDYSVDVVLEPITTYNVSSKWGIYTQYKVYLSHVKFNRNNLKLNGKEKWFTISEILDGKTSEGIKITSPFEDSNNVKELRKHVEALPLSLDKVQEETVHDLSKALGRTSDSQRIKELVKNDESISLEYKSSARWDYNKNQVNKDLEKAIVKTIAGFLNTEGGTLVIGMDDKKRVLGIENDAGTLSKRSEDGYRQYITALVTSYLGVELSSFIKISFEKYNEKELCLLDVVESPYPVFVREKEDREFYIRTANSTRQLNAEEVYKYIQFNW